MLECRRLLAGEPIAANLLVAAELPISIYPYGVTTGDVNGDARLDVLLTAWEGDRPAGATVVLNGDDGFELLDRGFASGPRAYYIAAADFDRNGHLDFAVLDADNARLDIWKQFAPAPGTSDPAFTNATLSLPVKGQMLTAADFDADGDADLAIVSYFSESVSIYLNDVGPGKAGDGSFALPPTAYALGFRPYCIAAGDANGDGVLDLAVCGETNPGGTARLAALQGFGAGVFGAPTLVGEMPGRFRGVVFADLDRNGKDDLAVTNDATDTISAFGSSSTAYALDFMDPVNLDVSSGPVMIAAGDFNGDGRPDLATAAYGGNRVELLLTSDTALAATRQSIEVLVPEWLAAGDFNGDGADDLAVTSPTNNTLTILQSGPIMGTGGDDIITVRQDGSEIVITVNGAELRRPAGAVNRLTIDALAGNDQITIESGLVSVSVLGGDGNDTIAGGGGEDTLLGGAGDDEISGGAGTDTLFGGDGNDTLEDLAGDDSIDGGEGVDVVTSGAPGGQFGLIAGKARALQITDGDGDTVTFAISGPGTGEYYPDSRTLLVNDTTAKSTLKISVRKTAAGDGMFSLGGAAIRQPVGTISAGAVALTGDLSINGSGASLAAGTAVSVTLARAVDASMDAGGMALKSLKVLDWDGGEITAASAGAIEVKGRKDLAKTSTNEYLPGNLIAQLTFDADAKGMGVGKITASGRLGGSLTTTGAAGAITAGEINANLSAAWFTALTARRNAAWPAATGNIAGTLTAASADAKGFAFRSINAGAVLSAPVSTTRDIGAISAGRISSSLAGNSFASITTKAVSGVAAANGDFSGQIAAAAHPTTGVSIGSMKLAGAIAGPVQVGGAIPTLRCTRIGSLVSARYFGSVTATATGASSAGAIQATGQDAKGVSISSIALAGNTSNLTISGPGSIKTLTVGGVFSGSQLRAGGSVDAITAAQMLDSNVLVGVRSEYGGLIITQAAQLRDGAASTATLKSLTVKGGTYPRGEHPVCFARSTISAARIGTVSLVNAEPTAQSVIWALQGPAQVKHTDKNSAAGNWSWKPGQAIPSGWPNLVNTNA